MKTQQMCIQTTQVDARKIIIQKGKKQSDNVYYIPGYLRIKVKNFTQMNLDNLNAQMNASMIFTVYYGQLGKINQVAVEKLTNSIILLFGRDDAILLTQEGNLQIKVKKNQKKKTIQFTIRKLFQLRIESQVFLSPFEIINLILSVTVQPVKVKNFGTIKINLLDHKDDTKNYFKLSYTEEGTFGNYDLAEKLMRASYTNERVCKVDELKQTRQIQNENYRNRFEDKLKQGNSNQLNQSAKKDIKFQPFQYAHFNVPLYKFPLVALATIFLPLWLLAIINLGIFFQDNNLADRIASIASLMIAFVALIPTIRAQIPPNPNIVFVEYLVYFETLTSLFALIHSIDIRNVADYSIIWYQDGLFMVSAIITVLSIISVIGLLIYHYLVWYPNYNQEVSKQDQANFQRKDWQNTNCDFYFTKFQNQLKTKKFYQLPDPKQDVQKNN